MYLFIKGYHLNLCIKIKIDETNIKLGNYKAVFLDIISTLVTYILTLIKVFTAAKKVDVKNINILLKSIKN